MTKLIVVVAIAAALLAIRPVEAAPASTERSRPPVAVLTGAAAKAFIKKLGPLYLDRGCSRKAPDRLRCTVRFLLGWVEATPTFPVFVRASLLIGPRGIIWEKSGVRGA